MDVNPAKRRKTDHSGAGDFHAELPFDAAAASAGMFRPSTFILETAELLEQSRVDYGKMLPDGDTVLRNLKTAVESLESHDPILIGKAVSAFEKKNSIRIPFPNPRPAPDSLLKLSLEKPTHCNVVGSYVSKTMIRTQRDFAVDFIVEMPSSLFQEKDYLNLRYFYKRAYYLAHIAKCVSKAASLQSAFDDLSFAYMNDNPLLPVLVATPKKPTEATSSNRRTRVECKIRIIPCCVDGLFPRQKLLANRNCIRPDAVSSSSTSSEAKDLPPTPFYNATIKAESAFLPYLKLLHQAQKTCSAFIDACLLGRVWLQQRGFGGSVAHGGFGAFEWAALVALLLQTGSKKKSSSFATASSILSPSLSSTQIFKAVIQFLASSDFRSKPCILGGAAPDTGLDSLREGTMPVLYDAGRQLNVGYKMSQWSAALLRQYAKWTHELLKDDSATDQFTPTFIARADIALEAFDMVLRIRCPSSPANNSGSTSRRGIVWDFGDSVFHVLKKAMGDRATLVHIQLPGNPAWPLDKPGPETTSATMTKFKENDMYISVGIAFDPNNMARHVDHGPAAEDKKEARKFREFWGERAELRRFKDGSILETLVWTAGPSGAFALCEEISRYILNHRLHLEDSDVQVLGGSFGALVPVSPAADAAAFTRAREAFATLEGDIRALDDLPLHVRQVAPISPALRSATIRPPHVQSSKAALFPMEVVLYFEASGKWPDSLVAIQRAKMAFLLRISESLEAAKAAETGDADSIATYVGLEDGDMHSGDDAANRAFLDIVYRDTAAFRLRIHSDLEESLLARQTRDKTLPQQVRTSSAHLLAAHRRLFGWLPLHTQTIATFTTRFPALSPTIRLVKRWFSAHKLACHVSDEFLELIVLHVFLRPHPWQTPASATPGLLRTLQFLARWDWRTEPLMVDTSLLSVPNELNGAEDATAAATGDPRVRLEAWRKIDPNMNHTVLFVAATHETSGTAFTTAGGGSRPLPSKVVAARMTSLARAACRLVKEKDISTTEIATTPTTDLDPKLLFQPSLGDYDVRIHLSPKVVKRLVKGEVDGDDGEDPAGGSSKRRSVYKNLDERTGRDLHSLPGHPVQQFLDQLKEAYGSNSSGGVGPIVFFHGAADDEDYVIAAMWNPQVHQRTFRVNMPCSFRPVVTKARSKTKAKSSGATDDDETTDGELIEVNREGILAEIARIGGSLIERIEAAGQKK